MSDVRESAKDGKGKVYMYVCMGRSDKLGKQTRVFT